MGIFYRNKVLLILFRFLFEVSFYSTVNFAHPTKM